MSDAEILRKGLKPKPTIECIVAVVEDLWSMTIRKDSLRSLDSYDDANFYMASSSLESDIHTREYLLKAYNGFDSDHSDILYGYALLLDVIKSNANSLITVSNVVPTASHKRCMDFAVCKVIDGSNHLIAFRLLEWIPGVTLSKLGCTAQLACGVGAALGSMTMALSSFDHPSFHRTHGWDLKNFELNVDFFRYVEDPDIRQLILQTYEAFRSEVLPAAELLPASVIMGDCNDANIIVGADGSYVAGIIDFGDASYTWTVNEIAVALCYCMLSSYGLQNPVECIACLLGGYASLRTLLPQELRHLRTLIAVRLSISISVGAYSLSRDPTNEYLKLHSVPAQQALRNLYDLDSVELLRFFSQINEVAKSSRSVVLALIEQSAETGGQGWEGDEIRAGVAVSTNQIRAAVAESLAAVFLPQAQQYNVTHSSEFSQTGSQTRNIDD